MIIRQSLLRHGRTAFRSQSIRTAQTCLSTEATSTSPFSEADHEVLGSSSPSQSQKAAKSVAEQTAIEYTEFKRQKENFKDIGGTKNSTYAPHKLVNNPPSPADVTLELLLASQSHMGHATSRWNPANAQYIFGIRDGTHIISLDVTAAHLRRAAKVVSAVTTKGGVILFVGTRKKQEQIVVKAAQMAGGYHVFERWVPGTLTNTSQILGRCRLKVVDELDREVRGYEGVLEEVPFRRPDLIVCLNPMENETLLREASMHNVPTIGVIDTDANPLWVTYPIPANDDSLRCISVIAGVLGRAGEEGKNLRYKEAMS